MRSAPRLGDFRSEELPPGIPFYSAERDGRSASPMRTSLVTLFRPGELQTTYFLDWLGQDDWGYFGLWGVTTGLLTGGHPASVINRAVALCRHFAGIPTDQEPPAAR